MGFLKTIVISLLSLIISGCTKSIVVKELFDMEGNITGYGIKSANNFYVDEYKSPDLELDWEEGTYGSFTNTSFVANDSLVFASDLGGRVSAFNISSGKSSGEIKYSGSIEQTAIIDKNRLLFIVNEYKEDYSSFIVYDFLKGYEVSSTKLSGRFSTELAINENSIFCVSSFGKIYSLSPFGGIQWVKDLKTEIYSNPGIDEKYLYVAARDGKIFKIEQMNGSVDDTIKINAEFESGVAMDNNSIYIGDNRGWVYSIDKYSGNINWKSPTGYKIVVSPGFDDNSVYVGNLGGVLTSINKSNGTANWKYESGGLLNTPPLIFKNIIFQTNLLKKLEILDLSDGNLLNTIEFNSRARTTPIYFRERIVVGIDKGEIRSYKFVN